VFKGKVYMYIVRMCVKQKYINKNKIHYILHAWYVLYDILSFAFVFFVVSTCYITRYDRKGIPSYIAPYYRYTCRRTNSTTRNVIPIGWTPFLGYMVMLCCTHNHKKNICNTVIFISQVILHYTVH